MSLTVLLLYPLTFLAVFLSSPESRTLLQAVMASETAHQVNREVAVGPLETDLLSHVTVHGAALAARGSLATGSFASAKLIRLILAPQELLLRPGRPLAAVRVLETDGLRIDLTRDAQGKLALPGHGNRAREFADTGLSGTSLLLRRTHVSYTDRTLTGEFGTPLQVSYDGGIMVGDVERFLSALQGRARTPGVLSIRGKLGARVDSQVVHAGLSAGWDNITLSNLLVVTVPDGDREPQGNLDEVRLDRVDIGLAPGRILRDGKPPLQALTGVDVRGKRVQLSRLPDGQLSLLRNVREWLPREKQPPQPLAATFPVTFQIERATYTDLALAGASKPLVVEALDLAGRVSTVRLTRALTGKATPSAGEIKGEFAATFGDLFAVFALQSDLVHTATITGLDAVERGRSLARADRVLLGFDLPAMAAGRKAPGLDLIEADRLFADVTLDRNYLPTFLPSINIPPAPEGSDAPEPALPRIRLTSAELHVVLEAVRSRGQALRIQAHGADADLSIAALAATDWGRAGSASGRFAADFGDLRADTSLDVRPPAPAALAGLSVRQRGQEILGARRGEVRLDWAALNRDPEGAVKLIRADGLLARILRDRDGELALAKALGISMPKGRRSGFAARVQITGGDVTYTDLSRPSGINSGRIRHLRADVDMGKIALVSDGRRARGIGTISGVLSARGPGVSASASVRANLDQYTVVRDFRVTEAGGRVPLDLDYARVDFAPHLFLSGRTLDGIQRAELVGGRFDLLREATGSLREARLISGKPLGGAGTSLTASELRSFRPTIVLRGISGRVTDRSFDDGPVVARVEGLGGTVNLQRDDGSRITGRFGLSLGPLLARAELSTNLWSRATATRLEAAEKVEGEQPRIAFADRVRLEYSLERVLEGDATGALQKVAVTGGDLNLLREQDGRFRLARLLGLQTTPREDKPFPADLSLPTVSFTGTRVMYTDLSAPAGTVELEGLDLDGQVNAGRLLAAVRGKTATGLGSVEGTLSLRSPVLMAFARVDARLDQRLVFSGLEIWEPVEGGRRDLVVIPEGQVSYTPAGLLGERPLEGLRSVNLNRPDLYIVRQESGALELEEKLRAVFGISGAPARDGATRRVEPGTVTAAISVTGGNVRYIDHQVTPQGEPLRVQLTDLDGRIPAGTVASLMERTGPARSGLLRAGFQASWPGATARGSFSTDVRSFAQLRDIDLRAAEGEELGAQADMILAEYDLGTLLAQGDGWPGGIQTLRADGLRAHIIRDERGRLDIAGLFEPFLPEQSSVSKAEARALLEHLAARVQLADADLRYTDYAVNTEGPVRGQILAQTADLRLERLVAATRGEAVAEAGSFGGSVSAEVPGGQFRAILSSTDIATTMNASKVWVAAADDREPSFQADWATAGYQLGGFFAEDRPPQAALASLELGAPSVWIERMDDGRIDLIASLTRGFGGTGEPSGKPRPAADLRAELESLDARVRINDARAAFVDHFVEDGPIELEVDRFDARLDTGHLWASFRQEYTGDIGWVRLSARASNPAERVALDADWRLDGDLSIRDASITRVGMPLPVLTAHAVRVRYEPFAAFGRGGSIPASILDINIDRAFAQGRRLETGRFELPRLVQAYLPEGESPGLGAPWTEEGFFWGFTGRVRMGSLSALYEDLSLGEGPASGTVSSVSADLDFARIAALRRGERVESPGTIKGCVLLGREQSCLRATVTADLGGQVFVDDLGLVSQSGRRRILTAKRLSAQFDPVEVFSGDVPLRGVTRIAAQNADADILMDASGRWELAHLLDDFVKSEPDGGAAKGLAPEDLPATVVVLDSSARYLDLTEGPRRPDLRRAEARNINGSVNLAKLWQSRKTGKAQDAGSIKAELEAEWRDTRIAADLDTDLNSVAHLRGVSVTGFVDDMPRELVTLRRGQIQGRLGEIIAGGDWRENIDRASLEGLVADVRRAADGSYDIARVLGLDVPEDPLEAAEGELARLSGVLALTDSTVRYADASLERPLSLELSGIQGEINLAAAGRLIDGVPANDAGRITAGIDGTWGEYSLRAKLSTDILGETEIADLALSAPGEIAPVSADRLWARYDLNAMLNAEKPLRHVRELAAERLVARGVRREDGSWDLLDEIVDATGQQRDTTERPDPGSLVARVRLADSSVKVVDYTVQGTEPLVVAAHDLDADIDLGAVHAMRADGETRSAGTVSASVTASASGISASGTLLADLAGVLQASDLRVSAPEPSGGDLLEIPRMGLRLETGPILAGEPPLQHVSYVELDEPTGRLIREADGRLRLARIVDDGLWEDGTSPAADYESGKFQGRLATQNPRLQYVDLALLEDGPLVVALSGPGLDLDLSDADKPQGLVNVDLHARSRTEQASLRIGGEVDKQVMVRDLVVSEPGRGEVFRMDRFDVYGNVASALGDAPDPLLAIQRVEIGGVRGEFRRDSSGRITSPGFIPRRLATTGDQAPRLQGRFDAWVSLQDVAIGLVVEELLGPNAPPVRVELGQVMGSVRAQGELRDDGGAVSPQGSVQAHVRMISDGTAVTADVETDILERAWLRNLASVDDAGHQYARVAEVAAQYNFHDLVAGKPLYRALAGLEVKDARVEVGTGEDGILRLAGLPVSDLQVRSVGEATTAGTVEVHGQAYTDAGGLVRGELRADGGLVESARGEFVFDPSDLWLDAEFEAGRVDIPLLGELTLAREDGRALEGTANAKGFAYGQLGEDGSGFAWSLAGELRDAKVVVASLGEAPVEIDTPFEATSEGIRFERADVRWAGVSGTVQGSVFDLEDPLLALDIQAQASRGEDLLALLPEAERERLQGLSLTDRAVVIATVTGPAGDAVADVRFSSPGAAIAELQGLGYLRLEGIDLTASVVGWKSLSVRAVASVDRSSLSVAPGVDDPVAAALETVEIGPAAARVLSASSDLGDAIVRIPWASIQGVPVTDLAASATLTEGGLAITGLRGKVLGGDLSGAGQVDIAESGGLTASGRVSLTDAELAGLQSARGWPENMQLTGSLGVLAGMQTSKKGLRYAADVTLEKPGVNGSEFDSGRVLVSGGSSGTRIDLASLDRGDTHIWVQGDVRGRDSGGPGGMQVDLRVAGVGVDPGMLPLDPGDRRLGGSMYFTGEATGDLRDPDLDLWMQIFDPQVDAIHLDAAAAHVVRTGSEARVDHLLASSGAAVLGVRDLRLNQVALYDTDGRLKPSAYVQGGLVGLYASASDIAEVTDSEISTGGWVHLNGTISGPARRPTLNALAGADHLQLGEFFVDEVRLPITVTGDEVIVAEGSARAHGGHLSVLARVSDLYGKSRYEMVASLDRLALEDLPPIHRLGLDVSGIASVPQFTAWGSRDDPVTGGATFRASNVKVRTERLEPVTGWVGFGNGLIQMSAHKIQSVPEAETRGGQAEEPVTVSAQGTLEMATRMLRAEVHVGSPEIVDPAGDVPERIIRALPDIGSLLQLAAPLVAVGEAARETPVPPAFGASSEPETPVSTSQSLAQLGLRTSGKVAGQLLLVGPLDELNCRTRFSVWDAELDQKPLPRRVRGQFGADLSKRRIYDIEADAIDGRQFCTVTGSVTLPDPSFDEWAEADDPASLDLTIEGADIDLPMWRDWVPTDLPFGGSATFLLVANGKTRSPTVRGSLDIMKPALAGAQFDLLKLPLIDVREGAVVVRRARLIRSDEIPAERKGDAPTRAVRELAMEGTLPWTWGKPWIPRDRDMDLKAELGDIDLGFFVGLMDEIARERAPLDRKSEPTLWSQLDTSGTVSASLNVTGPWGAPELAGRLRVKDGSVRSAGWERPVDDLQLGVRFVREAGRNLGIIEEARGRWGAVRWTADNAWAYLDHLGIANLTRNEYHMDLTMTSDRRTTVGGFSVAKVGGGLSLHTELPLDGLQAEGDRIHRLTANDLTAWLPDGSIRLSGSAGLTTFSPTELAGNSYDLRVTFDHAHLQRGKQFRGVVDGAVSVVGAPDGQGEPETQVRVAGELMVHQAEVGLVIPKAPTTGREILSLSRRYPTPVFDVKVNAGEAVRIRGLGITIPVEPSTIAHVTGSLHEPKVVGSISSPSGGIQVPGGGIQVNTANIEYEFGPKPGYLNRDRLPLELRGQVRAEARQVITNAEVPGWGAGDVEIIILVHGNLPDDIRVDTRSEPPLSEQQILALVGSEQLAGLEVGGRGRGFDEVLTEQALNLLAAGFRARVFDPIESELRRILGLSEFNVTFGFDQAVDIRLGKYLLKDLLVSYERSFGATGIDEYDLSVSYRLKNRLRVAYTTDERGDHRIKLSYDMDF
ncbi:MAG: translocation/assembly module TamB domain-containing protein [Armatimonadetes bacterium]|nr:translocation/assembly module TamB domain-containing protein [Armatimonadota bacterium]